MSLSVESAIPFKIPNVDIDFLAKAEQLGWKEHLEEI
jgi:hypothetical protein